MSKTVRFADEGPFRDYAESVATDILQERQKRKFQNDKSGKRKKRTRRSSVRQPMVTKNRAKIAGVNKGLLAEFVIFLLLQGFDLFSNSWVLSESATVLNRLEKYQNYPNVSDLNNSVPDFCVEVQWSEEQVTKEIDHFASIVYLYSFFLAITACIFTLHLLAWLYTLHLSFRSRRFNANTQATLIKMKVYFLIAASLLEDIPLSAIAAELFSQQQGEQGLVCWGCKVSGLCQDLKQLQSKLNRSTVALWLNFAAIGLTSLWKGISSFYRWSRVDYCEAFYIRACTAVFAGSLYCIVILTPAMTVLKYRYFDRPGISGGLLEDVIDRIYVIGAIFWVLVLAVIFCCPLLNLIRVTQWQTNQPCLWWSVMAHTEINGVITNARKILRVYFTDTRRLAFNTRKQDRFKSVLIQEATWTFEPFGSWKQWKSRWLCYRFRTWTGSFNHCGHVEVLSLWNLWGW